MWCSSLKLHLEDGERQSQPYSREHDWFGPDLMWNTLGRYILIFLSVLINPTRMLLITGPKLVSHYPPLSGVYYNLYMLRTFSSSVRHPPPWLEVYENHMAIIYQFYNHFKVTNASVVRTPFLTLHIFWKGAACCQERRCHKNFTWMNDMN